MANFVIVLLVLGQTRKSRELPSAAGRPRATPRVAGRLRASQRALESFRPNEATVWTLGISRSHFPRLYGKKLKLRFHLTRAYNSLEKKTHTICMFCNYDFWLLPLASDWVDRHSHVYGVHCFPVFPLFVSFKLECCEIYRSLSTHLALSVRASSARASRAFPVTARPVSLKRLTRRLLSAYIRIFKLFIYFFKFSGWAACLILKKMLLFKTVKQLPSSGKLPESSGSFNFSLYFDLPPPSMDAKEKKIALFRCASNYLDCK